MQTLHIGIDDTDSLEGGCTTYYASLLCKEIPEDISLIDSPNIVRLNPNVPYKTRGNGAVAIRVQGSPQSLFEFKTLVKNRLNEWLTPNDHSQPGIAFVEGIVPQELRDLYFRSTTDLLEIETVFEMIEHINSEIYHFPHFSGMRGIIGALAAIGWGISDDFTFELVSYRVPRNWRKGKRDINKSSIIRMNESCPTTFSNLDSLNEEIKIDK